MTRVRSINTANPARFSHKTGVTAKLGTVETVTASNSTVFGKAISRYIDSVNRDENAMEEDSDEKLALWPLIKEVHVFCKAKALSTGAVLVDLPGILIPLTPLRRH